MADASMDQQKTDEATLQQMQDIAKNIAETQPLIADRQSITEALRGEYVGNTDSPGFLAGIDYLDRKYVCMRRVRGDGNCFYRSLLYAYLETVVAQFASNSLNVSSARAEYERMLGIIQNSKSDLVAVGYDEFAVESFHETFVDFLTTVPSLTPSGLWEHFVEGGEAEYYTWYMRLLTAGFLRRQEERFFPFVDTGLDLDMAGYCRREVEPMGRECEQLHIVALTEYLGLRVAIEYLDGRDFDAAVGLSCIEFPQLDGSEGTGAGERGLCPFQVQLLYRPGHYDILYRTVV